MSYRAVRMTERGSRRAILTRLLVGLLLGGAIGLLYFSPLRDQLSLDNVRAVVAHLRGLWYGPAAFIMLYAIGCVVAVPASVFVIAAGVIWGWVVGGTYSFIGGVIGAAAAFGVAHFVGGGLVGKFGERGARLEAMLRKADFHTLLVVRFLPFPFPLINYAAGIVRVRFVPFLASTFVGLLPANFIVAYSGDALWSGTLSKEKALARVVMAGLLLASLAFGSNLLRKRLERTEQLTPADAE